MNSKHKQRRRAGFTLMEILVALIIISVLATLVGVNVLRKPGEARVTAARVQLRNLAAAVRLYHAEQGQFPSQTQGLLALVEKPSAPPIPARYPEGGYLDARDVPLDPWSRPYLYLIPGRDGQPFEIVTYGRDGEPGGSGEDADLSSADS
ncbi:MAG: type II secretion system major pseudopilin GspG [Candidatus Marinimicrobia bacterium]|nr:type II secretion system major pseudopilin GspG [Candidatus Neomarinimicrobiota bacterium]